MSRINIYSQDEDEPQTLLGWFDPGNAERFDQDKRWDGSNMIGVITGSQWVDEYLYRTKGGRWVLNRDAHRYMNGPDTYEFITDEQARDWLLRSEGNDEAVQRFFGEIEEERGPGRPKVGEQVCFTAGTDDLALADEMAGREGISRSALMRRALAAYVAPERLRGKEVRHLDGDALNNDPANLTVK